MTSPYDPYGKIYTLLSEEQTALSWSFEPVLIPQVFRDHLVLVLGWTMGRRGYVSIAMITSDIPDGANPVNYLRIGSLGRRAVANEITVKLRLRKNKRSSVIVELSYVRLDWVWEVPFAVLQNVPRTGMQLLLRAESMEKVRMFYSKCGWDQAWGQTYRSLPEYLQWVAYCQDQNGFGLPESIEPRAEVEYPHMTRQSRQTLNRLAFSGTEKQDGDAEVEALRRSDRTGSWHSASGLDNKEDGCLEGGTSRMAYAGNAHCKALAELLQEAQRAADPLLT